MVKKISAKKMRKKNLRRKHSSKKVVRRKRSSTKKIARRMRSSKKKIIRRKRSSTKKIRKRRSHKKKTLKGGAAKLLIKLTQNSVGNWNADVSSSAGTPELSEKEAKFKEKIHKTATAIISQIIVKAPFDFDTISQSIISKISSGDDNMDMERANILTELNKLSREDQKSSDKVTAVIYEFLMKWLTENRDTRTDAVLTRYPEEES